MANGRIIDLIVRLENLGNAITLRDLLSKRDYLHIENLFYKN